MVESETRPDIRHVVALDPGGGHCTCEDARMRLNPRCKHVEAVREFVLDLTITNEQRRNAETTSILRNPV